jgi:hypothetical protein
VPVALPAGDREVLVTGTSGEAASTGFSLRPVLAELLARAAEPAPQRLTGRCAPAR